MKIINVYRYKCPECGSTDTQAVNTPHLDGSYMQCFGWKHTFETKTAEIVVIPVPSTKK